MDRLRRKKRITSKISGSKKRPRLCVFRSNKNIIAQAVDDEKGVTIVSANLKEAKLKNNIDGAKKLGKMIAEKCREKKIETVVFDRGGYKYHGKVKAVAEGAREGGLKF